MAKSTAWAISSRAKASLISSKSIATYQVVLIYPINHSELNSQYIVKQIIQIS